ncbi:MAG: hypothetical protein ACC608_07495, partial [Anaerofustis sp.]
SETCFILSDGGLFPLTRLSLFYPHALSAWFLYVTALLVPYNKMPDCRQQRAIREFAPQATLMKGTSCGNILKLGKPFKKRGKSVTLIRLAACQPSGFDKNSIGR